MASEFYLGLDSSTQGITAVLADLSARRVAMTLNLNYERDFPSYGCRKGVLPNDDPRIAQAPPLLWAEALDALFAKLREAGAPLSEVRAIALSAQQHGSVYLAARAPEILAGLRGDRPLAEQLDGLFSRAVSPIWMDSSTTEECAEIRAALGGAERAAALTGSDVFERFTGPQIRRFWKTEPNAYEQTAHIAMISSFLTSLLIGQIAPMEPGDGSGMNLMDLRHGDWLPEALDATAPDLRRRLPNVVPSDTVVGRAHPWLQQRHGFSPQTRVIAGTGDNPSSLIGVGLVAPGRWAISLGTSDTCFGPLSEFRTDPRCEGHVFGSPAGGFMALICFQNGSLARERVRDAFGLDWEGFNAALAATPPGNGGHLLLPWFVPEIVPRVRAPGVERRNLDPADAAGHCRAVVEAQMMALRLHSEWMGARPDAILATGGASTNPAIRRIMAAVMGCAVHRFEVANSAALGAALRAAHADRRARGKKSSWAAVTDGFTAVEAATRTDPDAAAARVYDELLPAYAQFERETLARRS